MKAIPLPWLSERMARPVIALAPPPMDGDPNDERLLPPGVIVFRITVPPAWIVAQAPNALPGASCFDGLDDETRHEKSVEWERWVDRFLAMSIVEPRMSEADVQSLGPDRNTLSTELLRLWNWIGEHGNDDCPDPEYIEDAGGTFCPHFPHMPNSAVMELLNLLSLRVRKEPAALLKAPLDEFCVNFRVLKSKKGQLREPIGG